MRLLLLVLLLSAAPAFADVLSPYPYCPWAVQYTPDERCGASFFSTTPKDPFQYCCVMHDRLYMSSHMGFGPPTSDYADTAMLTCMLRKARTTLRRQKAYLYYNLIRMCGPSIWGYRPGFKIKDMPPIL